MIVEKRDGGAERRALAALIRDDYVLSKIAPRWGEGLLVGKAPNLVGSWCVRYFRKYAKAPKSSVESIYAIWAAKSQDSTTSQIIHDLLSSLTYEESANSEYLLDQVTAYLNEVALRKLKDSLELALDAGDPEAAQKALESFKRVDTQTGACVDLLSEPIITSAFRETGGTLIRYDGPIGRFFGDTFSKDSLVSFLAAEGTGKSFWLQDLAWRAMEQRKRVVYFECGDNTEGQVARRFLCRAAKAPWRRRTVKMPYDLKYRKNGPLTLYEEKVFSKDLDAEVARRAFEMVANNRIKSKESYCKVSCHPTGTLSLDGLKSILDDLERSNYFPEVVVIDYADILKHPSGNQDRIHQIEELWQALRALSMTRHCLVVTATQATRASYTETVLGPQHVSGNKLKSAFVKAMIGIAQIDTDKQQQQFRLNFTKQREEEFLNKRFAFAAHCLSVSNPCVASYF